LVATTLQKSRAMKDWTSKPRRIQHETGYNNSESIAAMTVRKLIKEYRVLSKRTECTGCGGYLTPQEASRLKILLQLLEGII